ncbi:MAG: hypothetical protein PUB10_08150 [Clostridiales bacterium]|nr:hypothetical protein [Clostridiales bacterium]
MIPDGKVKEWMTKTKQWIEQIGAGKILMIALSGLVLIVLSLPGTGQKSQNVSENKNNEQTESSLSSGKDWCSTEDYKEQMESELEEILENADGISHVKVMITLAGSREEVVLKDTPCSQESSSVSGNENQENSSQVSSEETTVLTEKEDGSTSPYVLKVEKPDVEGILIIADGVENAETVTQITEAAEALFGIPVHKIKVMKRGNQTES